MYKDGRVYCDECNEELLRLTEDEVTADPEGGWASYVTAAKHICIPCSHIEWEKLWKQNNPCAECRTEPCKKGRECWWNPPFGTWYPYETYYADRVKELDPNELKQMLTESDQDELPKELLIERLKLIAVKKALFDRFQTRIIDY